MNSRAEKLSKLIGMPVDVVKRDIDKGMWDILIELNRKNWFTQFSCEGHVGVMNRQNRPDFWQGYLVFRGAYIFPEYPVRYTKVNKARDTFYWEGCGEESRKEFLDMVLKWAKLLPVRPIEKITWYTIYAKPKNRNSNEYKILAHTTDYNEIRLVLAGADMDKYTDITLSEDTNNA